MVIIFSGLPGVGKTTIARELARRIGAMHLRIDSMEQAIRDSAMFSQPINDAGYRVAYAVAEDNLLIGRTVIADSVNPLQLTRDAWVAIANTSQTGFIEIEITCKDTGEHQRRVQNRSSDIPGLRLPAWEDVTSREYHPWNREHLVIDTASRSVAQNVEVIREVLGRFKAQP